MQTQVKVQMDERDSHNQPPPNPLQPPGQQMMGQSAYAGPPQVAIPQHCSSACERASADEFLPVKVTQSTVVIKLGKLS